MPLSYLDVQGYRSLRNLRLPLDQLNVVTGPNGSGKSNLYQALQLIARICEGDFARSICREGGLLSAMWAGPRTSSKPLKTTLEFGLDDFHFRLSCGFPQPSPTLFGYDPEIKEEVVWYGARKRPSTTLMERKNDAATLKNIDGVREETPIMLDPNESVLSQLREPHRYPELSLLRHAVKAWRFYHVFRTDDSAPLRFPQVSVRTPVLSHDGRDLAAALQSILEMGNGPILDATISAAFPGRTLCIIPGEQDPKTKSPRYTELTVGLETEGCTRPLLARELSDGTLKFLCLAASLLSPRPPELIAVNEPETSLHPDLLPPLAELIVRASEQSQVWVSTHSPILTERIYELSGVRPIRLHLHEGATILEMPE